MFLEKDWFDWLPVDLLIEYRWGTQYRRCGKPGMVPPGASGQGAGTCLGLCHSSQLRIANRRGCSRWCPIEPPSWSLHSKQIALHSLLFNSFTKNLHNHEIHSVKVHNSVGCGVQCFASNPRVVLKKYPHWQSLPFSLPHPRTPPVCLPVLDSFH